MTESQPTYKTTQQPARTPPIPPHPTTPVLLLVNAARELRRVDYDEGATKLQFVQALDNLYAALDQVSQQLETTQHD